MELWRVDETAVGNEGDVEISLYHTSTKSLTIMMRMSLSAAEMTGESGRSGVRVWGDLWDHCERVKTACHAAGVENEKGRAAVRSVLGIGGRVESSEYPIAMLSTRKATTTRTNRKGIKRARTIGEENA